MQEKRFLLDDILGFDSRYRRNFMNSIEGFKNAVLIGTCDNDGITNVAIFNSVVHIGATPPLIGFIHRPVTVPKQTFTNIQSQGSFTLNLIPQEIYEKAHQTSARYGPKESEFEHTGLTPEFSNIIHAPYVKESPVRMGLSLEEIVPIRSNGTFLVIGRVEELFVPENAIEKDGFVELSMSNIIACAGLDSYYLPQPLGRLAYAKRDMPVRKLDR